MQKLTVLFVALFLASCATILSDTSETITITTTPSDAKIFVDERFLGSGTASFVAKRGGANPRVKISRDGYTTETFKLSKSFNKTTILNTTTITFYITDAVTGAMFEYDQNSFHVQLIPMGQSKSTNSNKASYALERYILVNFDLIKRDLLRGHGEYYAALIELAPDPSKGSQIIREKNREYLASAKDPHELYETLAELFYPE